MFFNNTSGIILHGPTSTGKTFLSVYIANELIEKVLKGYNRNIELKNVGWEYKYKLKFIQATQLILLFSDYYNKENIKYIEELKNMKVLEFCLMIS